MPQFDIENICTSDMPILPMRNMVLFPNVTVPVTVQRDKTLQLIKEAYSNKTAIGVVSQKDAQVEDPTLDDLQRVGVVAFVAKILELPDNTINVILQGTPVKFHIEALTAVAPYLRANVSLIDEQLPLVDDKEFVMLVGSIQEILQKILKNLGDEGKEIFFAVRNIDNPIQLINFVCANFPLDEDCKQELLEANEIKMRAFRLYRELRKHAQMVEIQLEIQKKTHEDLSQQQREHFLHQQIHTIQEELGDSSELEFDELRQRATKKKWSEETAKIFEKELRKLERFNPSSPEYSTQYNYLDTLLNLPWGEYSKTEFNFSKVEKQLNKDHFGLEKVKDRILEHLAVMKLRTDMGSPIICLVGPPGVGKTSLGRSIAEAMGRGYVRISLGGLHDEAEIRGHRRTYIGAMPGRILQGIIKAKASNPVFVLDEIDKMGGDYKGDPASALLEVLDPEQNSKFHDNFVDLDFDLSKVFFIATANSLQTLPRPLLDRLEIIEVSGYIEEEKVEIARKHLIPKQLKENGFSKSDISFHKEGIVKIIDAYTRESGVRQLEKCIAKILRRTARKMVSGQDYAKVIKAAQVTEYLGVEHSQHDLYEGNEFAGVVTGLAWTSVGGEILFIESSIDKCKGGEKLTLTGNLGNVMKESATIALQYIKANCETHGLNPEMFEQYHLHIHVPEGATPKDGPSAGVTMVTSLISTLTQRKVRSRLAMTGEITLRGKVLPVGGIKEKILAAKRAGIREIILCEDNKRDIEDINEIYLKGLTFHYVHTIKDVIDYALLDERVSNAIDL